MTATDYVQAFDTGAHEGRKAGDSPQWLDQLDAMIRVSVASEGDTYVTQYTAGYVTGLCDRLRELDKH